MSDNRTQWDAWRKAEDARSHRKSVSELNDEGYNYYKQSDFRRAAERFRQAAALAGAQGDVDSQCDNLQLEGHCLYHLDRLKAALERLLRADALGGGDAGARFWIVDDLCSVANELPLPRAKQEELLKKLAPYKGTGQIGGSKSAVLNQERALFANRGDWPRALARAQEAFASQADRYPALDDSVYYWSLVRAYRENGLLREAWNTLRDWRARGSTVHAKTKSEQFRAEAQLLYAEGRPDEAWDAIRRCQAEERYLNIHGQIKPETLTWLIRIAVDTGRFSEARACLSPLFRFHRCGTMPDETDARDGSLYYRFDCFYWFAYYYAGLSAAGGGTDRRYDTPELARARAARWYRRAERVGRELDDLLETDVKRKELEILRAKLAEAGLREGEI